MKIPSPNICIRLLVAPAMFMLLSASSYSEYTPPHSQPGPATDVINFNAFDIDIASKEIEAGAIDFYNFSLKTPAAEKLASNNDITIYKAPASTLSIVLNPAPALEGDLNPLSIKGVRQALQIVVNRSFIAQELYKGFAVPMLTHVSHADFDYLTLFRLLKESHISHDPELAKDMVSKEMTSAGATLENGFWHFNDKRIDLKFIVRTEDERWDIGNTIRSSLLDLGFSVVMVPQQFGPAIYTVYGTDPRLFQWHLYTEGWGRGSPERYDFATINQMCAPWLGNMPGWQEVGFWQYESSELDEMGQRLFTGDFSGLDERNQIYLDATKLCLDESVRIWVVTAVNNIPAISTMTGITEDLVSGPKSIWTLREAHIPGSTEQIDVGSLWVWTNRTTWNPIGGFGDVYSNDIWNNLHDTPITTHPFTGLPIPFRSSYEVETAGPTDKLNIPDDAFTWDAENNTWKTVDRGTRSTSKVTYDYSKYFQTNWHHDQNISMADVIYPIAQLFDMVYDTDKSQVEFSIATTSQPFTDTFKGFRITSDNKLEVYVDFWHFVDDYIAQYSNISPVNMPWEILAAMDDLVFEQRKAAYSDTTAARFNVPWLSLVMDKDARLVRNTLRGFNEDGFVPTNIFNAGGQALENASGAKSRYSAAIDWFADKKHMVVSNGPFYLQTFDSGAQFAQIKAYRDQSYPFRPGDLFYGEPQPIDFVNVRIPPIQEDSDVNVSIEVAGPGKLSIEYILQNPSDGRIIASGAAENISDGLFEVLITSNNLGAGTSDLFHLYLAAYSDSLATMIERKVDLDITATALGTPIDQKPTPTKQASDLSEPTKTDKVTLEENSASTSTSGIFNIVIVLVILAAGVVGIILIVIVIQSRRSKT